MGQSGALSLTMPRARRAGAVIAALTLGITGLTAISAAQTPPAKKPPDKAPPAAAKKDEGGAAPQTAWVKLCEAVPTVTKEKDGKEKKTDAKICMTMHE